jgi:hypothetical protein
MGSMGKMIVISTLPALMMCCGPDTPDEDEPPGTLEYEIPTGRFYRLDRRLEIVGEDPMVDRSGCGLLTDRAYEDLMSTVDGLDPNAEYERTDCESSPDGLLHIEGFVHSPFDCNWYCCHGNLLPMVIVYWAAGSSLYGQTPNIDGEPYVALEPDVPCP